MEQWKDIKDFEGWYQISDLGNVRSLDRVSSDGRFYKGSLKAIGFGRGKYNIITLYKGGEQKSFRVHRLVAEAFISNPDNKSEVNHIDGNKNNNHVGNLEWSTSSENQKHAYRLGLQETFKGEDHIKAKLTNEQAWAIKYLRKDNPLLYTMQNLANMYNVSVATISLIMSGRRYKNV